MEGTSLIIRADDFGLYHAANQAIEEGFEAGLLTSATLAGAGPWLREAVALLHEHPQWEVGLELQLNCGGAGCSWGPVAGRVLVPSLVTHTGDFPPQLSDSAALDDVRREFDSQINRLLNHGVRPAFLECVSDSPLVNEALGEFGGVYNIPARMTAFGLCRLNPSRDDEPFEPGKALGTLGGGAYLWVVRPAHEVPETWALWSSPRCHAADALAVCDPQLAALMERRGIRRRTFQEHLQSLGT
jgi:YdjC-like protein